MNNSFVKLMQAVAIVIAQLIAESAAANQANGAVQNTSELTFIAEFREMISSVFSVKMENDASAAHIRHHMLGTTSKANLMDINLDLKRVVERAIEIVDQDFAVHAGLRTAQEQFELYRIGRTLPGDIVTTKDGYDKLSNHQAGSSGLSSSVDLVPYVQGQGLVWDWDLIYPIAVAMSQAAREQGVKIRWGGNWYETMDQYGGTIADMKAAVVRYRAQHPGKDFIDGPHFEIIS